MGRDLRGGARTTALPNWILPYLSVNSEVLLGGAGSSSFKYEVYQLEVEDWLTDFQGVVTCVVAIIGTFFIVDFPELATRSFGAKFLNDKEVEFIVARIEKDRHDVIPVA